MFAFSFLDAVPWLVGTLVVVTIVGCVEQWWKHRKVDKREGLR